MSEKNVEIVRRAIDVFNESGFEGFGTSELVADDIEFHEPPEQPAPRVARGREEVLEMTKEFDSAWAEHQSEAEEIRALDAERVLLLTTEHFKGRDGIEVDAPFGAILTLRDGTVVRWQAFWDRQNALDAAGLSE
jgi:ketosteroid isomerase-like protein